ncbi:hypothetical protein IGI04_005444 [Brassica rapa subsp. trilocularis]|uniref:Secreted protein n=1 Tax=Brassica rapa subsp. trilocularis TaxID=1813537 RepID=A0ABQ7NE11_BRACM|nr:hypothetical protein IGI04_005444 [Brassica rapa subsp. trilocularis]
MALLSLFSLLYLSQREKAIITGSFPVIPCIGFVSGKGGYHSTVLAGLCLPRVGLPFRSKRCFGSIYAESKSCRGRLVAGFSFPCFLSPVCLRWNAGLSVRQRLGEVGDVSAQKHVRVPPEFGALHV